MGRMSPVDAEPAEAAAPPQVFTRTFNVPPGLPWDQSRAAALETRHGSPLPIHELLHRVRRLGRWAPGEPGRYAAFYVRRHDYAQPFETTLQVDGATLRVAFGSRGAQLQRLQPWLLGLAAAAGAAVLVGAPLWLAWTARSDAAARLERLETRLAARDRQARQLEAGRLQALAVSRASADLMTPADLLADLGWLARAKTPGARIVAVHWERGALAVEARGEAPPLAAFDRRLERSAQVLRPGVWLWGVSPILSDGAPSAAQMRGP